MEVIWAIGPATAPAILEALRTADASWHPKTAGTLLNRLARKGALGFRKEGRGYVYYALAPKEACLGAESESFLKRLFGGSLKPMLAYMVDSKRLTPREIAELRDILERKPPTRNKEQL